MIKSEAYSTTEQVVGTWIDGKPLYRKVFTAYMPTTATDGTYVNGLTEYATNIEYAWIVAHWTTDASGQNQPLPYFTNSGYFAKAFITNNQGTNGYKYLVANAIKAFNGQPITVIVQYTKTTDNAIRSLNLMRSVNEEKTETGKETVGNNETIVPAVNDIKEETKTEGSGDVK